MINIIILAVKLIIGLTYKHIIIIHFLWNDQICP